MARSLCNSCGETFRSVTGFDKHRIGDFGVAIYNMKKQQVVGHTKPNRRCMSVAEMLAAGMMKNDKGWWITSAYDEGIHEEEDNE